MQKYRDAEIKSFEFNDLKSNHVVTQQGEFQSFSFKTLTGESVNSTKASDESIRTERDFAAKNNFKIDDIVKDYRGLSRQEQTDLEKKIQAEVKRRLEASFQDAYKEGLEKGRLEGEARAYQEVEAKMHEQVDAFTNVIEAVKGQTDKIIENNRSDVYEFVKRFTKWIILKEVNEKTYLTSLLEKLILELNARKNLIVKVGRENFADMPDIVKAVEAKLGHLSNVRIEIAQELTHPGIILESENGLIDGSLEGVFNNIDKIFEQVVGHE
jgi:flagellar assembly protein FliH